MVVAGEEASKSVLRSMPYGRFRPTTSQENDPHDTFAQTYTEATCTGQYRDSNTELMYYGARFYDPFLGRFISPDSVVPGAGNPQNLNRYSYTLNNPLRYTDPTGHYVDEGNFCLDPSCSYSPTSASYQIRNGPGSVRADTFMLSPAASESIFGVAVAQRVSQGTTVSVADPSNVGMLYVALAMGVAGAASSMSMPAGFAKMPIVASETRSTTVLGENMSDRVIPFANKTDARTLPFGTTAENWDKMTPQERWHLNDGSLRKRIGEGDQFRYIGVDPDRDAARRLKFDLTRSELLRLQERGIPYETVPTEEIRRILGRP